MPQDTLDRAHCRTLDAEDPLANFRDRFARAKADTVFLDANSVGAMPKTVPERMADFFQDDWTEMRRRGWNARPWLERPKMIGAAVAPLIGAEAGDVLACDNTSVNLFKLLAAAWRIRRSGSVILTEKGNFPTDLYVAQGLACLVEGTPKVRVCETRAELLDSLDEDVAAVFLSQVDYRNSERWDMAEVCARARAVEALTVWDLSQSAGAVPVDVMGAGADFATGCGYKYLSMGPGGPAYVWVHPQHQDAAWPAICGWMGHADVFAFATDYAPMTGVGRQATGTPMVIANEVAWCAAEIWKEIEPRQLWAKHEALGEVMIAALEQECGALGLEVTCPRDYARRGGHICFSHPGAGAVSEALLAAEVVGSFRKPDSIRFGLGALALGFEDIWETVARLRRILEEESWRAPQFQKISV